MGADSLSQLCTWVNAAYGVHPDLKIHTGGCMTFGYGMVHCTSSKQIMNTKSSTEDKVVSISDYLTYNICIWLFMRAQGYGINQNILFQDNQSAIHMEKNGKKSCTGNYRQINIRYFFANDRTESKKKSTAYCSTQHMLSFFYEIPTRIPICNLLWCNHAMEACRYPTDVTTLNQGACWKCG